MKITLALSAAAVALLMTAVGSSVASPVGPFSDTLTVGSGIGGVGGGTETLCESGCEAPILGGVAEFGGIPIDEGSQDITGAFAIFLTEPGSTALSDVVSATITGSPAGGFFLDVKLRSDGSIPLITALTAFETIPETGAVQDLTNAFTGQFDLDNSLPTIQVTSDVSDVPEPSTWAMMMLGFAGLGYAGYRGRRSAVAAAI
jgi:hypothetical protein